MKLVFCFSAFLFLACEGTLGRGSPEPEVRQVIDTLWGWQCEGSFYYAPARPGTYPNYRPPPPPVYGVVFERDTLILFISEPCPVARSLNTKKSINPLESLQF